MGSDNLHAKADSGGRQSLNQLIGRMLRAELVGDEDVCTAGICDWIAGTRWFLQVIYQVFHVPR